MCLRRGHLSREFCSQGHCHNCNGHHHTSICNKKNADEPHTPKPKVSVVDSKSQSAPPSAPLTTTSALDLGAPVFTSPPTSTSLYVDSSQTVHLQTAFVEACKPGDSSVTMKLRIILDSGSQRSYVTQRVKDALALVPSDKQTLSIAAFEAKRGSSKPYNLVHVTIKGRSGHQRELELFVVPSVGGNALFFPAKSNITRYFSIASNM